MHVQYIHNFCNFINGENANSLPILDFGLSVFYIVNGKHVQEEPEEIGGTAAGTLRYLSIYAHRHKVLSRRDDIESIGYVLIYLLKGDVAWSSRSELSHTERSERVLQIKQETSLEVSDIKYFFLIFHNLKCHSFSF